MNPNRRNFLGAATSLTGAGLGLGYLFQKSDPSFEIEEIQNKQEAYNTTGDVPVHAIVTETSGEGGGLVEVILRVYDSDENLVGSGRGMTEIAHGTRYRVPVILDVHSATGTTIESELNVR